MTIMRMQRHSIFTDTLRDFTMTQVVAWCHKATIHTQNQYRSKYRSLNYQKTIVFFLNRHRYWHHNRFTEAHYQIEDITMTSFGNTLAGS